MSSGPVIGIDLGTTNSVVAVADGTQSRVLGDAQGRRLVPSVVSFRPDGRKLVGYEARERRLTDAANTVYAVKRLIGRPYDSPEVARARERFAFEIVPNAHGGSVVRVSQGNYALAEISALVLKELKRVAEDALGVPCKQAVVTVPANFNELQRSATQAAGRVAGLDVLRILNEPTAAALAYGHGKGGSEKVAVYDLGGGTFDITILELDHDVFEVLATAGDTFLGGEDIDLAIAERMADAFIKKHRSDPRKSDQVFERLKAAAEWAKCQLTHQARIALEIDDIPVSKRKVVDFAFALSQAELEELARPLLQRSLDVADRALISSGTSIADLDRVVMVGGMTRMPLVRRMVADFFGQPARTDIDPDLVVAQGAAIHGFSLAGPDVVVPPPKVPKRRTAIEMPRGPESQIPAQPAFAPHELLPGPVPDRRHVARSSVPPGIPALPSPSQPPVLSRAQIVVDTPKSDLEIDLEALLPPEGDFLDDLDVLQPPEHRRPVSSREPTAPFSIDRRDSKKNIAPPPLPAAARPPPVPPPTNVRPPPPSKQPGWGLPAELAGPLPPLPVTAAPVIAMPDDAPPLLMDVTPHSLGLETVRGYCRQLIGKNAPLPTEQTRIFTTGSDDQREVAVRIAQGEDDVFENNEVLGEIILDGLPSGARGSVQIEVGFILDASGMLVVSATDLASGRAQEIRISLRGGLSEADVAAMRSRMESEEAAVR
ncbi:MAG: Hsp70 family protein [Sandaracinaceae bacterium]